MRELMLRIDNASDRAAVALKRSAEHSRMKLERLHDILFNENIKSVTEEAREKLDTMHSDMMLSMDKYLAKMRERLALGAEKINAMNPLSVLRRGYAIAESRGAVIHSVESVKENDSIELQLSDGKISATVNSIKRGNTVNG